MQIYTHPPINRSKQICHHDFSKGKCWSPHLTAHIFSTCDKYLHVHSQTEAAQHSPVTTVCASGNKPQLPPSVPTGQYHLGTGISQACPSYSLPPAPGSPFVSVFSGSSQPRIHGHRTRQTPPLLVSLTMWKGYFGVIQDLLG